MERPDGHGRVMGSAVGHGPKKVENRWCNERKSVGLESRLGVYHV